MAKQVQLRRGTTAQHSTFTGVVGEVTIDTDLDTIKVHDGSLAGGHRIAKYSDLNTSNVTEGTNLYYSNARVYAAVTGNLELKANVTDLTTSNVTEGTNLYYTNTRVYAAVTGNLALKANVVDLTTSNVTEGTNLYYTNARVRAAITTGNTLSYNSSTGNITLSQSGVTAATYGNATIVPVLTVDEFGRVTAASNVTISGGGGASLSGQTDSASPYETALGSGAGAVTTGVNNTFIGFEAGNDNTTGTDNTAVGYQALDVNTTGALNTAVGSGALGGNTTAAGSTAIGYRALNASTGQGNIAIGRDAALSLTTGTSNIAVGWNALANGAVTGIDNIAIGSYDVATNWNGPLSSVTSGSSNIGIGGGALQTLTTGANNVAVGNRSMLRLTTASNNTALGYRALGETNTGANNVAVGYQALLGVSGNAHSNNVAVGYQALYANTTASNNTAIGYQALYANTTGTENTAVGYQALTTNTTGSSSTAVGYLALNTATGNANTAVGYRAGRLITSGAGNTLIGTDVGGGLTLGSRNTFIGVSNGSTGPAGYLVTTGSKNVIIGGFDGNQDGLDIRTASNYAVISDGDGNRLLSTANGYSLALDGGAVPQSGTGITFPATENLSTNGNTLDDYEEGTWTPTVATGWTSVTYAAQSGKYTKVGNLVTCFFEIVFSGTSAATTVLLGGLPFTVPAGPAGTGALGSWAASVNATSGIQVYGEANTTRMYLLQITSGSAQISSNGNATNSSFFGFITYNRV